MPIKQDRNLRLLKLWSRKRDIVANRIRFNDFQKKSVYAKRNGKCVICGKSVKFKKMTIDHITPLPGVVQMILKICNWHVSVEAA